MQSKQKVTPPTLDDVRCPYCKAFTKADNFIGYNYMTETTTYIMRCVGETQHLFICHIELPLKEECKVRVSQPEEEDATSDNNKTEVEKNE